jgi:hypothetical protein
MVRARAIVETEQSVVNRVDPQPSFYYSILNHQSNPTSSSLPLFLDPQSHQPLVKHTRLQVSNAQSSFSIHGPIPTPLQSRNFIYNIPHSILPRDRWRSTPLGRGRRRHSGRPQPQELCRRAGWWSHCRTAATVDTAVQPQTAASILNMSML